MTTISFQDIQAQVGSTFTVHTHSGTLELKLHEAEERPRRGLPARFMTPISLIFAGPDNILLAQDAYYLDHPVLGRNQWILVPVSKYATPEFAGQKDAGEDSLALYEALLS